MTITPPPATSAQIHAWSSLPEDHPMPLIARRRIIGKQVMISQVRLSKGCIVPTHAHFNEQMACVMSGSLQFGLGLNGADDHRTVIVNAGEVIHLPANVPHSAEALVDSLVFDIFSPPSEKTGIDRS